ncbi:hypothetical protein EYC84_005683 [Monilinia fructicola]|uniref:Uncharacterized protein n=1 Tax=Monilinia fructicola TaxID=38448 RepID=A0A5M9K163_MONFR|nr:hypothetical protein EYC84_005683 [Monilinia fructicola]
MKTSQLPFNKAAEPFLQQTLITFISSSQPLSSPSLSSIFFSIPSILSIPLINTRPIEDRSRYLPNKPCRSYVTMVKSLL